MAKRKRGIYKSNSFGWLKIKNPKYSQAEGRRAMSIKARKRSQVGGGLTPIPGPSSRMPHAELGPCILGIVKSNELPKIKHAKNLFR